MSDLEVIPPESHVHPDAARFQREFDMSLIPGEEHFHIEGNVITGERENTDWSRLGLTFGAFFALGLAGIALIWIPGINILWALVMLALLVTAPILGARAAIFRLRKGCKKTFRIELGNGRPKWQSNDDAFWKPVREFFKLE